MQLAAVMLFFCETVKYYSGARTNFRTHNRLTNRPGDLEWTKARRPNPGRAIFKLTTAKPLDAAVLWGRLRYFWFLSAFLVTWLCFWAVIDRKRLRAATRTPQPPPLTIPDQAARLGIDPSAIPSAREFKITNVLFREDGTISGFEQRPIPAEFRQTSTAQQAN